MSSAHFFPRLKPYAVAIGVLTATWITVIAVLTYNFHGTAEVEEMEMHNMFKVMLAGACAILVAGSLIFGGQWIWSRWSDASQMEARAARPDADPLNIDAGPAWSLEIRGVGFTPGPYFQVDIWQMIKEKNDDFSSIYSQDIKEYTDLLEDLRRNAGLGTGAAFRLGGRSAVAYWPIPVFVAEPPSHLLVSSRRAADLINEGRNGGGLGVTLFLWQQDANVAHAQQTMLDMFSLFDSAQELPLALMATRDGDVRRDYYSNRHMPRLGPGPMVPVIIDTTATLLLGRTDRVDHYIRPFAATYKEDNQDDRTDLGRLWQYFFKTETEAMQRYAAQQEAKGFSGDPGTMPTADWHAALPGLWAMTDNRGPGQFTPTPWLPTRWAQHQVDEYDRAPYLGHLHRPIKVNLRDSEGNALKPALQAQAMQEGWTQALATLPAGETPVRVFHDSHDGVAVGIALNTALQAHAADGKGIDLGNVNEGYDIGRRVGNLGLTSPLVQIGLGAIASYHEGGVSAVVYGGDAGSVTIQMVRPPSDAEKAHNDPSGTGHDPFMRWIHP